MSLGGGGGSIFEQMNNIMNMFAQMAAAPLQGFNNDPNTDNSKALAVSQGGFLGDTPDEIQPNDTTQSEDKKPQNLAQENAEEGGLT